MKNYTITVNLPNAKLAKGLLNNDRFLRAPSPGQWVIWDGPTTLAQAKALFEAVKDDCVGALLSVGKDKGRCVVSQGTF